MRGGFHHDQPDAEDRVNAGYVKMDKDGGEGAEAISKAYRNVSIRIRSAHFACELTKYAITDGTDDTNALCLDGN